MGDRIPTYADLLWPTLQALIRIDGSGHLDEIDRTVIEQEHFSESQQAVPHKDGPKSKIEYRLAWARTYLKGMGLLENSARGVWSITEAGRSATLEQVKELHADFARRSRERSRAREARSDGSNVDDPNEDDDWRTGLLKLLLVLPPDRFERLARRLLREAGFIETAVTGKSGDGGIDGVGSYQAADLLTFPVVFQCKRYRGSVGAGAVRDFRGAMAGRGDKGLMITTGTFTSGAKDEATRDGVPRIDLIDGEQLCELLKRYEMGVTTMQVERIDVVPDFFDEI